MPNRRYLRGAYYERKAIASLEDAGYNANRSAGSHGVYDIIAYNSNHFRLIQIKSTQNKVGMGFYRKDLVEIFKTTCPPNGIKELWIYGKINGKNGVLKICVI